MKKEITGIILAGGKNSRMRLPKAFLEINGRRIIDHSLSIYRKIFPEIIIVCNDPLSYTSFSEAMVVTDIYKSKGPLGGIHAGLFYAGKSHAFVTACDMPFLNESFIRHLLERGHNFDITVPRTAGGFFQPLHAMYSRKGLPVIEKLLLKDQRRIDALYEEMHTLYIHEDEIKDFDSEGKLFHNINTVQDLKKFS